MRAKLNYFVIISIFITSIAFGQTSENVATSTMLSLTTNNPHSEDVVAEFGENEITLGEFEKAYAKNVGGFEAAKNDSLENYKKFLDLYVTYKMKLRNAFVRDYQNDEELMAELNDYKEKVGVSYIEEKKIIIPGMKKFYNQRGEEVRVSHIMFKATPNSDKAEKLANAILDSIKNGKSFEEMVKKYSEDNFSKTKGGDIYWFTAGQIIPSFEFAAYSTQAGEVYPEVVKTKYGYHILKVTDKHLRKYKVRAKHILIKSNERAGNMVDAIPGEKPLVKIKRILDEIKAGADFDSLAKVYSEDPGSGAKGGDLGYFERRQMVEPFDNAVFQLKVNEVSDIVKTRFGYHIVKLTEVLDYPPFDKEIENIRELYKKARYQYDYDSYMNDAKQKLNFSINDELLKKLIVKDQEISLTNDYTTNPIYVAVKDSNLISITKKNYSIEAFFDYLNSQLKYENKALTEDLIRSGAKEFGNEIVLKAQSNELEKTDSEFASLMDDYKNGIFIFKLKEDEVWNKVKLDTAKLQRMYNNSKNELTVEGQVNFNEIFSRDKNKIEKYYQMLKDGVDFDSIAYKYTERPGFKAKYGRHGFVIVSENELAKKANTLSKASDYSEIFPVDGGYAIVILRKKVAPRTKTFEEALPELSSNYQEMESKRLEKNYVDGLKKMYQPEYFYDELENAYKYEN